MVLADKICIFYWFTNWLISEEIEKIYPKGISSETNPFVNLSEQKPAIFYKLYILDGLQWITMGHVHDRNEEIQFLLLPIDLNNL